MKRGMRGSLAAALGLACLSLPAAARADKADFERVAEFKAEGDAKEVSIERKCEDCMIRVMQGRVIISTLVVREGGKKTPIKVTAELKEGDKHVIPLGERRQITGFRISDGGGGTYRVYVR